MACIGALCDELLSWRVINKIIRFDSCDELQSRRVGSTIFSLMRDQWLVSSDVLWTSPSTVEFCKTRDPITYYVKSWRSRMRSWRLPYHIICFQDELSRYLDTFTSRRQLKQFFFLVLSLIYIITVLASTTVDLYFLHYFHLDSSEVVQLVQFKFKIF